MIPGDTEAVESPKGEPRTYTFTRYVRLVLPLDGYVFWVKADLVGDSALYNAISFNAAPFNSPLRVDVPAREIKVSGSMHYGTDVHQDEGESYASNTVVFTSQVPIQDLSAVNPNSIFIAEIASGTPGGGDDRPRGSTIRYAFSQRRSFYEQAGIHHYVGHAVYSDMQTQVIDGLDGFDSRNLIVSNSLPLWLALNGYLPATPAPGFGNTSLTLYPSFLVPDNLPPPFAAVHISPESTEAIGAAPLLSGNLSHSQLVKERVRITIWGARNFNAMDFVDCVNQYSLDLDNFGIMNMPVIRDEKRTQPELLTIAMKKSIEFEINYYQLRARDVARQLIKSSIPKYVIGH